MSVNAESLYAIETPNGRLLYQAESLAGIINAAACIHEDFPGEDFVVTRAGEYDAAATLLVQNGFAA